MTKRLKTSEVFLDTQVFVNANFQFDSGRLKRLEDLSESGKINLYLTDITIREIDVKISEQIEKISKSIKIFCKEARILKEVPSFAHLFNLNIETVSNELNEQFKIFIALSRTTVISTQDVSIAHIFDKYFTQQPPFGGGKKKHEFPDAFVIRALEDYCENTEKSMYVISDDGDIKSACSSSNYLISLNKVDELFDLITAEDELFKLAQQWFEENEAEIKQGIIDDFEDMRLGFCVTDQDADVESVKVNSVDIIEKNLVEIQEDSLNFKLDVEVFFSAEVSYPDPDMTVYDREEGEFIVFETINKTLERDTEVSVDVEFGFSREKPHDAFVISVCLEPNDRIKLKVDDEYPYK